MTDDDQGPRDSVTDGERAHKIESAALRWQRHLVDLGGRNSLLWKRADDGLELDLTMAHPAGMAKLLSGRNVMLSELIREPHAYAAAYEKAIAIRDVAAELMDERGILSMFLAMGRASWQMGGDDVPAAPILLRQCDIQFGGRHGDDLILDVSRVVELNSALSAYLASRGVNIDESYLTSLASGPHGFDPGPTYAMMRRAGATLPGFRVDPHLVLAIFSYAKLSMVRDVSEQREALSAHPVIAAMAGDEAAQLEVSIPAPQPGLDVDPRAEYLVLDADSQQEAAIDAVMAGSHLVLMGPPGTGKSQTIANLVATLAAHGRSALFVAEKRVAIDAVIGRLAERGLGDLVLDAHAGSGTAADLIHGLARRLVLSPPAGLGDQPDVDINELESARITLLEHVRALHSVRDPFGVSASDAQTRVAELHSLEQPPRSRARISADHLARIDREARDEIGRTLVGLSRAGAWQLDGSSDPWFGAHVRGRADMETARDIVTILDDGVLAQYRDRLRTVCHEVGLPAPASLAEASDTLDLLEHVGHVSAVFTPEVFCADLPQYVEATRARTSGSGSSLGLMQRRRLLKSARACLREGRAPSDLHSALAEAQTAYGRWREFGGQGTPKPWSKTSELIQNQADLAEQLDWLGSKLAGQDSAHLISMPFDELEEHIHDLAANVDRLEVLPDVTNDLQRLRALGLGAVVDDFATRGLADEAITAEWEFIWWTSVLATIRLHDPAYEQDRGNELRDVAARFADVDRHHVDSTPERVRERASARVDDVARQHPDQVEAMETALVFGHHAGSSGALRSAFASAPDLMTALAPCWAMSPLVVAQTIPPGAWFDVVIFDEASQIPPAEAISAITRGRQVVVAGDAQQLAPTSFFQRTQAGEDTAHTGESILDVLAPLLPVQNLQWHYRSLDERLIAFSNQALYDGSLVTFPRAQPGNVLRLHVVRSGESLDGAPLDVSAGGDLTGVKVEASSQTVRGDTLGVSGSEHAAEVAAVVELVRRHAQEKPGESLGVITLGLTHARHIQEALRRASEGDAVLGHFVAAPSSSPFFVKNLERVQGDERDAIILSLGIAPNESDTLIKRFGALNHEGGERRLNVAITRARQRMDVVAGFAGEDLDPAVLRSRGALMLRDFLLYVAECDERIEPPTVDADGVARVAGRRRLAASSGSVALQRLGADIEPWPVPYVVEDLAKRLRDYGLVVHTGYGYSRMRLDIAIEDPRQSGRMLMAVESDGEHYAAMGSVRERDRLRVEALERLGWVHDRVWTVDLFRDPVRDAARILERVNELTRDADGEW